MKPVEEVFRWRKSTVQRWALDLPPKLLEKCCRGMSDAYHKLFRQKLWHLSLVHWLSRSARLAIMNRKPGTTLGLSTIREIRTGRLAIRRHA